MVRNILQMLYSLICASTGIRMIKHGMRGLIIIIILCNMDVTNDMYFITGWYYDERATKVHHPACV